MVVRYNNGSLKFSGRSYVKRELRMYYDLPKTFFEVHLVDAVTQKDVILVAFTDETMAHITINYILDAYAKGEDYCDARLDHIPMKYKTGE